MRGLTRSAMALAALTLVLVAAVSRTTGILTNTAIVSVLAVLMTRSRRTDAVLRGTRTWMLAALLAGTLIGMLTTSRPPVSRAASTCRT